MNQERIAVLLLAGKGERFGSSLPKQYVLMGGRALFLYSAEKLFESSSIDKIVMVCPTNYEEITKNLLEEAAFAKKKPYSIIVGGASREESCYIAVSEIAKEAASDEAVVLIHDGDRPFLSERLIKENIDEAKKNGASITAIPSKDSVCVSKLPNLLDGYLPREEIYLVQTPQAFRLSMLLDAFRKAEGKLENYKDEGSLFLSFEGIAPKIVLGDEGNVKITSPADIERFKQ